MEALLGTPEGADCSVLIAMLTQKNPGIYEIEDLTGEFEQ